MRITELRKPSDHMKIVNLLLVTLLTYVCGFGSLSTVFADQKVAGLTMPDALAELEYQNMHNYEKDAPGEGLGVSLSYAGNGCRADIYIYDMNFSPIPDGVASQLVREQFTDAQKAVIQHKANAKVLSSDERLKFQGISWLHAILSFEDSQDGSLQASHLYITAKDGQFIKVRFSGSGANSAKVAKAAKAFIGQLSRQLNKS